MDCTTPTVIFLLLAMAVLVGIGLGAGWAFYVSSK